MEIDAYLIKSFQFPFGALWGQSYKVYQQPAADYCSGERREAELVCSPWRRRAIIRMGDDPSVNITESQQKGERERSHEKACRRWSNRVVATTYCTAGGRSRPPASSTTKAAAERSGAQWMQQERVQLSGCHGRRRNEDSRLID